MLGRDPSGRQDILLRELLPPCRGAGPREPAREFCLPRSGEGREAGCAVLKRPSSWTRQVRSLVAGFGAQFPESQPGPSGSRPRSISAQQPGIRGSVPGGRAAAVPLRSVRSRQRRRPCFPVPRPGLCFLGAPGVGPPSSTAPKGTGRPAVRRPPLSASAGLLPAARAPYLGAARPAGLRRPVSAAAAAPGAPSRPPASRAAAAAARGVPGAANLEVTSTVGPTRPGTGRAGWREGGADPAAVAQ